MANPSTHVSDLRQKHCAACNPGTREEELSAAAAMTGGNPDHGPALRALIWTCAVLIIAGVYVLAVAVLVGAVLLITGAV